MFWKQKDNRDLTARRSGEEAILYCKLLEKRVYLLEHPEQVEKERILDLQQRVAKGHMDNSHGLIAFFYTEQQLQRYAQEISDYYAKKVKDYALLEQIKSKKSKEGK